MLNLPLYKTDVSLNSILKVEVVNVQKLDVKKGFSVELNIKY